MEAGCDIIRCTVKSQKAAIALTEIRKECPIPLVADIHFDYRLALKAIEAGVDKVRINPGNIGDERKIALVLDACKDKKIPIRIGVNAGSLEDDIIKKTKFPTAEGMVQSALRHIQICEKHNFTDLIISLKSSHTAMMIEAYRELALLNDYPLHLGVTEAGTFFSGTIKSAIGIGTLLAEGIGDTIRVSLTDEPEEEIKVGREILKSLGLSALGVTLVSCPTCGRLEVDLFKIVKEIEKKVSHLKSNIRLAVMGCVVNGPGEAMDSDLGVACTKGRAFLYVKGKKIATIRENEIIPRLLLEIDRLSKKGGK
jgi:(E)-4-hydroxy-3-methylbut-2-enyl-diphosphate synthase